MAEENSMRESFERVKEVHGESIAQMGILLAYQKMRREAIELIGQDKVGLLLQIEHPSEELPAVLEARTGGRSILQSVWFGCCSAIVIYAITTIALGVSEFSPGKWIATLGLLAVSFAVIGHYLKGE